MYMALWNQSVCIFEISKSVMFSEREVSENYFILCKLKFCKKINL